MKNTGRSQGIFYNLYDLMINDSFLC